MMAWALARMGGAAGPRLIMCVLAVLCVARTAIAEPALQWFTPSVQAVGQIRVQAAKPSALFTAGLAAMRAARPGVFELLDAAHVDLIAHVQTVTCASLAAKTAEGMLCLLQGALPAAAKRLRDPNAALAPTMTHVADTLVWTTESYEIAWVKQGVLLGQPGAVAAAVLRQSNSRKRGRNAANAAATAWLRAGLAHVPHATMWAIGLPPAQPSDAPLGFVPTWQLGAVTVAEPHRFALHLGASSAERSTQAATQLQTLIDERQGTLKALGFGTLATSLTVQAVDQTVRIEFVAPRRELARLVALLQAAI